MIIAKTVVALPGLPVVRIVLSSIRLGDETLYFVQTVQPPYMHYRGASYADAMRAYRAAVDNILSPEI